LISVRRAILRNALRAEEVFGMAMLVCGRPLASRVSCAADSVKTGGGEHVAATTALIMAALWSVNGWRLLYGR
jgi:hypothetical protein